MSILFLSNGHGEDACGAAIASELMKLTELNIIALPIIGMGQPYINVGIPVVGPHQLTPMEGLIYKRPKAMLKETAGGLARLLIEQIKFLRQITPTVSTVVAVGDVVPLIMNRLGTKKPVHYVSIAKSAYYTNGKKTMLKADELWALNGYGQTIFFRDEFTATCARKQRPNLNIYFVGNPMMDTFSLDQTGFSELSSPIITILPGSRQSALTSLKQLLSIISLVLKKLPHINLIVSKAPQLRWEQVNNIILATNWQPKAELPNDSDHYYVYDNSSTLVVTERFGAALAACDLVIGLAGTANEQAVGLGKLVISFPTDDSKFAVKFLDAQERLLGKSLHAVYSREPKEISSKIIDVITNLGQYQLATTDGIKRMGDGPGAAERIAHIIADSMPDKRRNISAEDSNCVFM